MANPVMLPGLSTKWEFTGRELLPLGSCDEAGLKSVNAHIRIRRSIAVAGRYNRVFGAAVFAESVNEAGLENLSPSHPQAFVDNLCMTYPVGSLQRREIEQRRGLQRGSFDYNEIPTSSCHTFCWKARH